MNEWINGGVVLRKQGLAESKKLDGNMPAVSRYLACYELSKGVLKIP